MTYLSMQGITKYYPGVVANNAVKFEVEQGEIHALVGENGAGKSTLMKILYGLEQPDAGQVAFDGQQVSIPNPYAAIRMGIGMVHQHFQLIPSLTVGENIALGFETRKGLFVDQKTVNERVQALSQQYGLAVDPTQRVADLSVGIRQRVEILKMLYRDARLLILDEPSAVLTPQEVDTLFDVIQNLVQQGCTAIFITHKLREVMAICQRATILRRGEVVGTLKVAETTPAEIARMMVGSDVDTVQLTSESHPGPLQLQLEKISAEDDRRLPVLKGINLSIHGGEIVGLAGVEGNGQHELLEVLIGLRKLRAGTITIGDTNVTAFDGRKRREHGLSLIPEDRNHEGLSNDLTIWENMAVTRYYRAPQSQGSVMRIGRLKDAARDLMKRFDVRATSHDTVVGTLSGGNAQKVVIARELAETPRALIAAQPTRGLDIGAARFVHEQLVDLRNQGVGILLISADLDELLAVCDRLVVLFEGRIVGSLRRQDATREQLGLLMAGRTTEQAGITS